MHWFEVEPVRLRWLGFVPVPRLRLTRRRLLRALPLLLAAGFLIAGLILTASRAPDSTFTIQSQPPPMAAHAQRIDLNRATAAELETVPRIGAERAAAILQLRAEAPFRSLRELVERGVLRPAELADVAAELVVYAPQ